MSVAKVVFIKLANKLQEKGMDRETVKNGIYILPGPFSSSGLLVLDVDRTKLEPV